MSYQQREEKYMLPCKGWGARLLASTDGQGRAALFSREGSKQSALSEAVTAACGYKMSVVMERVRHIEVVD